MSKLKASEFANLDNCYGKGNAVNCYAELDHLCEKENSALVSLSVSSAAQKSSPHPLSSFLLLNFTLDHGPDAAESPSTQKSVLAHSRN